MNESDQHFTLGRIDGKLDQVIQSQKSQDLQLNEMDARLRNVEVSAAKAGAISGTIVSVGMALIVESFKAILHIKP
jgi:hypothetical protein